MRTLLLSPILGIALYVAVCLWVEKRRLRALALANKCPHGTHRSAHCWQCEEEQADREMDNVLTEIRQKRERMDE